jgi:hypothetical protein
MRHKLVLWFLLVFVGFLVGFQTAAGTAGLSASTKQLGSCQSSQQLSRLRDTATIMYLEVVQKNW